jgi:hypothetical protein
MALLLAAPKQAAPGAGQASAAGGTKPKQVLHPILIKGQLRRFGTPPEGGLEKEGGAEQLTFQASWDHIDLTPPAARWSPCPEQGLERT